MEIDNFQNLQDIGVVKFDDPDLMYFIQIIQRKKENPDLYKGQKVVRTYLIDNYRGYYGKVKDSIIKSCNLYNARAYIRVNRRSKRKTHIHMIKYLSDLLLYEQYDKVYSAHDTVLGRYSSEPEKKWIIDFDNDILYQYEYAMRKIHELLKLSGRSIYGEVNTPNGKHLITGAFNKKEFGEAYPNIDIHKDNMTILYSNVKQK